ncbi:hypothetical protein MKK84_19575 [Methylobacterium sp. E-065]|uniref:hypothetical protein n=1 Tax=Methylobacterium sp. E-065 TaxID=2836583 RepID=UPI001FBC0948|nr:hypothetical protein [Methylobacterium sp. E-065]MCJ2019607.1 hypothetical protein [Methylobacterium sp. E-065]
MSGGVLIATQPVARLLIEATEEQPARVLVASQPVATLVAVAEQGPAGRDGKDGPAGGSFGQITYTDRVSGPEDRFEAGARQQLRLAPGSTTVLDLLLPPFAGHVFVHDDRFWPRAPNDAYDIHINLLVVADQAGTKLKADVDVGSTLGPIQADGQELFEAAGVNERITFSFSIQALENTQRNGAAFFLKATKPVTLVSEAIYIVPQSVQPAAQP